MRTDSKKRNLLWIFAVAVILLAGTVVTGKTVKVWAGTTYYNKLVWNSAHTERYYYNSNGQKVKNSWVTVGKYKYYFDSNGCAVLDDWIKSGNDYYYVNKNGAMYTNRMVKVDGHYYYLGSTGAMHRGWLKLEGDWYYFKSNGSRVKSWQTIDDRKYYFNGASGKMATGWVKSGKGNYYYFEEVGNSRFKQGQMYTSWLTYGNRKYYFRPSTGIMLKDGTFTIGGKEYTFDKYGVLNGKNEYEDPSDDSIGMKPGTAKTLKNLMLNALQPVGKVLYTWGGGHGYADSTRIGLSPLWQKFYKEQPSSYQYTSQTEYGLDCSGYVGWVVYNALNTTSGGTSLTDTSGKYVGNFTNKGWGTSRTIGEIQADNYKVYCGDIGGNDNHVWMILGQCKDKSVVILHSTPNAGVQIAGTPVPSTGNYSSEAIALATKYMSRYEGYKKFEYRPSSGNYLRQGPHFTWNVKNGPLKDPDGYRSMTANAILKDIFGY